MAQRERERENITDEGEQWKRERKKKVKKAVNSWGR
jgi:hypothetical protein